MPRSVEWVRDPLTRMELELQQWGAWVRSGVGALGYGQSMLGKIRGSTVPTPAIADERALEIDGAMQRLKGFDQVLWGAIWYTFVEDMAPERWASRVGVGRTKARYSTLPAAMRWMVAEMGLEGV